MKKLKKFWRENSVLLVLLMILIACIIAMSIVLVTYFVGDSSSKYGDRLEGISEHEFSEADQKEIVNKLKEEELVDDATIKVSGKTIYVTISFATKTTLVEAQSKALASLEYFSENIKGFYDLEYLIEAKSTKDQEGFQIMGSHNVNGTGGIVWNNNTALDNEEE